MSTRWLVMDQIGLPNLYQYSVDVSELSRVLLWGPFLDAGLISDGMGQLAPILRDLNLDAIMHEHLAVPHGMRGLALTVSHEAARARWVEKVPPPIVRAPLPSLAAARKRVLCGAIGQAIAALPVLTRTTATAQRPPTARPRRWINRLFKGA